MSAAQTQRLGLAVVDLGRLGLGLGLVRLLKLLHATGFEPTSTRLGLGLELGLGLVGLVVDFRVR